MNNTNPNLQIGQIIELGMIYFESVHSDSCKMNEWKTEVIHIGNHFIDARRLIHIDFHRYVFWYRISY